MSFFDEGDEPRQATRPRQPRTSRPRGAAPSDPQQLMIRRAVAAGGALLLIILLVVGVRGCLNSQKKRSLKDYNREVSSLVQESDSQVSKPFFQLLNGGGGGGNAIDLETQVNQFRATAEDLVKRAKNVDTPDDMKPAQSKLVLVLELRRDALAKIASKVPTALGDSGAETAVKQITGQMSAFLASDVVYSQRVFPVISGVLADNKIGGQEIAQSQFLPGVEWLDETFVAGKLGASIKPGSNGKVAPGLHGHGLTSVSVGNVTLQPGVSNRIPAGADTKFLIKFQNQGENDEFNVPVKITIEPTGGSGKPISLTKRVATTKAGSEATVEIPLSSAPPIGTPVTITVAVTGVPGEKKLDNNKNTYPALFTP